MMGSNPRRHLFFDMEYAIVWGYPPVLVGYDFDTGVGVGGTFTQEATFTHANIDTATIFTTGSGLNDFSNTVALTPDSGKDAQGYDFGTESAHNFGGTRAEFGYIYENDFGSIPTLADAIGANDYMTFTVTPDSGQSLDLTSFTFRAYLGSNPGRSANNWAFFSSSIGFDSGDQIAIGASAGTTTWSNHVVDLSGLGPVSETTEFRLYIYGAQGNGNSDTVFDKVVLNGAVVPEPGTYALLAGCLALTSVMLRRRR